MIDLTQQILRDPAAMKKIMAIYSSQAQSATSEPSKFKPSTY